MLFPLGNPPEVDVSNDKEHDGEQSQGQEVTVEIPVCLKRNACISQEVFSYIPNSRNKEKTAINAKNETLQKNPINLDFCSTFCLFNWV